MELLNITLAASEKKQFRRGGASFEIIDSTYGVDLKFYSPQGGQIGRAVGALSGLFLNLAFGAFDIENGGTAQTITVLVCEAGEGGGSRRTPGNVRVIDSGADKTAQGTQFIGAVATSGSAGGYSLAGLRALSGAIIIKRLQIVSNTAGTVALYQCNGDTTNNPSNYAGPGLNKLQGQGASLNRALRGLSAAANPTSGELPGVAAILVTSCAANTPVEIPLTTPLKLPNGFGVVAQGPALNASVQLLADWEEAAA